MAFDSKSAYFTDIYNDVLYNAIEYANHRPLDTEPLKALRAATARIVTVTAVVTVAHRELIEARCLAALLRKTAAWVEAAHYQRSRSRRRVVTSRTAARVRQPQNP